MENKTARIYDLVDRLGEEIMYSMNMKLLLTQDGNEKMVDNLEEFINECEQSRKYL